MKKTLLWLCCIGLALTGCNKDTSAQQKIAEKDTPLKPEVQNALASLKGQGNSSVTDVLQALSALDTGLQLYETMNGTCQNASLDNLDVSVSLPGYNFSIDDVSCTAFAQQTEGDDAGTKFAKKRGSATVYCSGGTGRLCNQAATQGVIKTCAVSLSVGGYKIGDSFTNKGFNGIPFKKQDVKAFSQYVAGDKWADKGALTVLVDNSNQKIVYIEKQQGGTVSTIIRAVEKQGATSLQKITSMGVVFSGNGKLCGKYDVSVGTESGDYDYTADQGIVTVAVADSARLQQLKQKLEDVAAEDISL